MNEESLSNKIRTAIIIVVLLSVVPWIFFVAKFHDQVLSNQIVDWGDFGDFVGGVINPLLTVLNIVVLIILTKTAAEFNKRSLQKQLSHSTCKEYQNKINDLTFEFFENLELFKEMTEKKYLNRATERLLRIKFFVDSFIIETETLIKTKEDTILTSKEELKQSIDNLISSNYTDKDIIEAFFNKKSKFIKSVFNVVIK